MKLFQRPDIPAPTAAANRQRYWMEGIALELTALAIRCLGKDYGFVNPHNDDFEASFYIAYSTMAAYYGTAWGEDSPHYRSALLWVVRHNFSLNYTLLTCPSPCPLVTGGVCHRCSPVLGCLRRL